MKPSNWIDHMAPADGPPPTTLRGFFYWSLRGSFKVLALSGFTSILTGITEVSAVLMLGMLVDAALASSISKSSWRSLMVVWRRRVIFSCASANLFWYF